MMENTNQTVMNLYFNYWKEHINPIEEEKRGAQFNTIMINVSLRLYGPDFALELAFLMLKQMWPDEDPRWVSDSEIEA